MRVVDLHKVVLFTLMLGLLNASASKITTDLPKLPLHFGKKVYLPKDNPMTKEGIALGRMLFYEPLLSADTSISCGSCHQQRLAFTDGRAKSMGLHGKRSKRSAMSLVNLLWVSRFFWDGRVTSLEAQALVPIQDPNEMDLSLEEACKRLQAHPQYPRLFRKAFGTRQITPELMAKAIAQFERTLISANSRYDKIVRGEADPSPREQQAIHLFMTHPVPEAQLRGGNCGDCHGSHLTTLNTFHNNGLEMIPVDKGFAQVTGSKFDMGKMRAPSLRNIVLTAPYMHDGRFKTLEEVLEHYNEHIQPSATLDPLIMEASNEVGGESLSLSEEEKADIIFFLHMLTDSSFIQNPAFANPH